MNNKDREDLGELKIHVKYICESIDEIKNVTKEMNKQMNNIEKISIENRINLTNHLTQHKRDIVLLTVGLSIITFIINYVVK